jgi:dGTPase
MNWNNCYSGERFSLPSQGTIIRTEFERDWDRIIFSSAFRRLQNKTQVFPLPEEVFVHNRLTHSLEVASVGRSLGELTGQFLSSLPEVKAHSESEEFYKYHLKHVIASACLAHDLGNPAFGHSGEDAISAYFREREHDETFRSLFSKEEWADLVRFEGNANALRTLTCQYTGRLPGGFRLTYSTLGAILKYPCEALASKGKKGPKHLAKYGFFQADREAFEAIAEKLNMYKVEDNPLAYKRHPFVYLVEAADDICYSIIDVEDAHRLSIFSTDFVIELLLKVILLNESENSSKIRSTLAKVHDNNEKIAYLRAKAINVLTLHCAEMFRIHADSIIQGEFTSDLISVDERVKLVMKEVEAISVKHIYNHPVVVKIELSGFRIMGGLLEDFIDAALSDASTRTIRHKNVLRLLPSQFMFDEAETPYMKAVRMIDFASGMTDLYALKLYRNLRGIEMPNI